MCEIGRERERERESVRARERERARRDINLGVTTGGLVGLAITTSTDYFARVSAIYYIQLVDRLPTSHHDPLVNLYSTRNKRGWSNQASLSRGPEAE